MRKPKKKTSFSYWKTNENHRNFRMILPEISGKFLNVFLWEICIEKCRFLKHFSWCWMLSQVEKQWKQTIFVPCLLVSLWSIALVFTQKKSSSKVMGSWLVLGFEFGLVSRFFFVRGLILLVFSASLHGQMVGVWTWFELTFVGVRVREGNVGKNERMHANSGVFSTGNHSWRNSGVFTHKDPSPRSRILFFLYSEENQ